MSSVVTNLRHRLDFSGQSLSLSSMRRWFQKSEEGDTAETSSASDDARDISAQDSADSPSPSRQQSVEGESPIQHRDESEPEPDLFDQDMMRSLFTRGHTEKDDRGESKSVDDSDIPSTAKAPSGESGEEVETASIEPSLQEPAESNAQGTFSAEAGPDPFASPDEAPDQPLVRTMVETLASGQSVPKVGDANDFGASLGELFEKRQVADPRVKAILKRHEAVDIHALASELHQFAQSIGAGSKNESD